MNSLKGYYGHTLGASGILETIITMHSVVHGELLGTRGFSEIGVSGRVNISAKTLSLRDLPPKQGDRGSLSFVKIISGFGGCNAAVYCALNAPSPSQQYTANTYSVEHYVRITPPSDLTEIYKQQIGNYPKFYKMDKLSQLGFIASELLLKQESPRKEQCTDRAVVLFNHSSSVWVDREYAKSIAVGDDYFPSPSLFVYTLPNIVCGEIAVRNGYHAETSFYILPHKDENMMHQVLASTFLDETIQSILTGWIDYEDDQHFEAELKLIKR
jgi:3-oxoacyl-[acyl-carrier-protein] synthase-1